MSDGTVRRGQAGSYTEESIEYWLKRWMVMKALGAFDRDGDQPATLKEIHDDDQRNTERQQEFSVEENQEPVTPVVSEKKQKKRHKGKKKGKGGRR